MINSFDSISRTSSQLNNFGRRLKTLKGLAPHKAICKVWTKEPDRFTLNPHQQMPGLNI